MSAVVQSRTDRIASWLKEAFGPVEFSTSIRRRGFMLSLCPICKADVHDTGTMCPRQCSADCAACGQRVLLDGYLNCSSDPKSNWRTHTVHNIRPTTTSEWRRMQPLEAQ